MATEKQIAANRRNGKRGGPKTAEGKARSRTNALKTGLSALDSVIVLLPGESQFEFDAHRELLLADFEPVGTQEERDAALYVSYTWRLRRVPKIEQGILLQGVVDADEAYLTGLKESLEITYAELMRSAAGIRDPQTVAKIIDDRIHEHLEQVIADAVAAREADQARLGAGFLIHADALTNLIRYETALFNGANQVLERLLARQAERRTRES